MTGEGIFAEVSHWLKQLLVNDSPHTILITREATFIAMGVLAAWVPGGR